MTALFSNQLLLLFDIDGTLLLSGGAGNRALNRSIEQITGQCEGMTDVIPDGKTDYLIIEEAFRLNCSHLGLGEKEIRAVLEIYPRIMAEEVAASEKFRLMPGVPDILDACQTRGDCLLGVATGNLEEGARIKLSRGNLLEYFLFGGYGSDAIDRTEIVRKAIERGCAHAGKEVPPDSIFVIGDTPHDIFCARKLGVRSIGVAAARFNEHELREAQPDWVLPDLTDPARFFACLEKT